MTQEDGEDKPKYRGKVVNLVGRATKKREKPNGSLGCAVALLSENYPKMRFNSLLGMVEDGPSAAEARLYLEEATGDTPRRDIVVDALEILSGRREYDPLLEHISLLPEWDGICRVGHPDVADAQGWLTTYANAVDSSYVRSIGKNYLIGTIARALKPGCKMDCILALVGDQGAKKSSLFEVLGGPFYKSNLNVSDLHGKEARQEIRGSWVVEFPELSTLRKSDFETAKGFLSECTDRYRPSYGRTLVSIPRRCVFGGTINRNKQFIPDNEVQRRLWVCAVGKIDLERFSNDRDQILAEAKVLFERGEHWWIDNDSDSDFTQAMESTQEQYQFADPWMPIIEDLLSRRNITKTYVAYVLREINLPLHAINKAAEMRCAEILRKLGWRKGERAVFEGGNVRTFAWHK